MTTQEWIARYEPDFFGPERPLYIRIGCSRYYLTVEDAKRLRDTLKNALDDHFKAVTI